MDPGGSQSQSKRTPMHGTPSKAPTIRSSKMSAKLSPPNIFATFTGGKDPVRQHFLEDELQKLMEQMALAGLDQPRKPKETPIVPDMSIRTALAKPPDPIFPRPPYVYPESHKEKQAKLARRLRAELDRNFCKWDDLHMPKPVDASIIDRVVNVPSPDVSLSRLKVFPRKPSVSPSQDVPEPPDAEELELHKPKSGIFINVKEEPEKHDDMDSFDMVFERQPRPKRPGDEEVEVVMVHKAGKKRKKESEEEETVIAVSQADEDKDDQTKKNKKDHGDEESPEIDASDDAAREQELIDAILHEAELMDKGEGEGEDAGTDAYLTRMFRRKVSLLSKATSLDSRDLGGFPVYDEEDLEGSPYMTRIIQKFRRDSEAERYKPPPRKIKRGTLESHSFTKVHPVVPKEFYFGLMMGTINQRDEHFGEASRGVQGMCMAVAAYCYSMIIHPNKWNEPIVDDVLEVGDKLYNDSIGTLHMHKEKKELEFNELYKYCLIDDSKVRFQVFEPDIVGLVISDDKRVYDLAKGLKLFYQRHRAGILKTTNTNIVIWKDKYYYFFDARGRGKDLSPDEKKGKALLANFYDISEVANVLLQHSNLGDQPYSLSKISVFKVMDKNAPEEDGSKSRLREGNDYYISNENKAVIQGSFDLADLCFDFSRNKQAIAMAAVCLVYSRITPPSAWHEKTVDKIMIIGNQLYLELVESENVLEMELERLPASFTVGPYVVQIQIYSNIYADLMFRKSSCIFQKDLEKFFETNTMALVYVGKSVLAIWKQRNMYYCFDPYSRNTEGLRCRNGAACISMNADVDTLVRTVTSNFDNKDDIFHIHALKVLKIHRDPAQNQLFPKTMTMDEFSPETFKKYKMKKSKRKAVEKPVTADFGEPAAKRLLPWDFLGPSIIEVGSGIDSLTPEQLPQMVTKFPSRAMLRAMLPEMEKPIDLDSPSLSDTQIYPERPAPVKGEEAIDMEGWDLTQEELEMQGNPEEGGEGGGGEEGDVESYMAMARYAQVHTDSLDPFQRKTSAQVNTDLTVGFLPVPREILPPTNMRWKQKQRKDIELAKKREVLIAAGVLTAAEVTQSMELAKPSNFTKLPDNSQLIRGTTNIAAYGTNVEFMAPFICMMAGAVAQKYTLTSWSPEIIDYTLKSGAKLYKLSKVRYDQVPILEIPKVSLGRSDYTILVQYLFDTTMKQYVLEMTLEKVLFKKYECGLVVTPSYACTVFFRNHLYYLFDCFACNEVGLGEGPTNQGFGCFARFKTVQELAARIMHNKTKRDSLEEYEFSRFVVSSCVAKFVPPEPQKIEKKGKGQQKSPFDVGEESEINDEEAKPKEEAEKELGLQPENRVGYQLNDGVLTLQGSMALKGRYELDYGELKEDHFVCVCACLMILNYPVMKWDTKRVNYVVEQGRHIYSHAENLMISKKRIIRNILIYKHFFDIIVTSVDLPELTRHRTLASAVTAIMHKRLYIIVQFPNCSYVVYKHGDFYHVFDPYACLPNGKEDESEEGNAGWALFRGLESAIKRIREQIVPKGERYIFYTFEVTSVRKAPKKTVLSQRLLEYELDRPLVPEQIGKPFHEKDFWLKKDPLPWSRIKALSAKEERRGTRENMWHNWDVEYPKDLFSLVGTLHQTSVKFAEKVRGKQTLANLVVACGMLEIYGLAEWSAAIMDSILTNGNEYFAECIKDIRDEDYELTFDDLKTDCRISPYSFEVVLTAVVEGTMFLMRQQQFNLFKALRLFLDNWERRFGIICVTKGDETQKRFVAFGKTQESEYFMYDCQAFGPPMFLHRQGAAYILRCKTLKRLLHVMVMTLRGGDFFVFEVDIDNLKEIS